MAVQRAACLLAILAMLCGCEAQAMYVVIVRTDFVPGRDFARVQTTLDAQTQSRNATPEPGDWVGGVRVAELAATAGEHTLQVTLLGPGDTRLLTRPLQMHAAAGQVALATVLLTRDCLGVECDPNVAACLTGRCVPSDCAEETPDACTEPQCASDADCEDQPVAACASRICADSRSCFTTLDPSACASQSCDAIAGCIDDLARFPWNGYRTGVGRDVSFVLEPAGATATHYELQLDPSCDWRTYLTCSFMNATRHEIANPNEALTRASIATSVSGRLFWRVRACTGAACGSWSAPRYVDVDRLEGDLDEDGDTDVTRGDPTHAASFGWVTVFRAPTFERTNYTSFVGGPEEFGASVAAGDVTGDSVLDLIVGAPGSAGGAGQVFLLSGVAGSGPNGPRLDFPNPSPAASSSDGFGRALAVAGDMAGDGFADFVIGCTQRAPGLAHLYFGDRNTRPEPVVLTGGPSPLETFGAVGDLNGDGLSDIAVGAPIDGVVHVYWGSREARPSPWAPDVSLSAGVASFGHALRGRDLNEDGFADLVVGAPADDAVYVYYGSRVGLVGPERWPSPLAPNSGFGNAVSIGDTNADGIGDLFVGAPDPAGGALVVFLGAREAPARTTADLTISAPEGGIYFGSNVAAQGDVNGDGATDPVVSGVQTGVVQLYLFYGATSLPEPWQPGRTL